MPTSEEILMAAAIKARDASEISEAWANGPENTTVETASGPLDTLAEFQRKRANDIMQGVRRVASVAALRLLPARYDGEVVYLASYYDGWAATLRGPVGFGNFVWDAASTATDKGNYEGFVFALDGVATGRWIRKVGSIVTPEMCGSHSDDIQDDAPAKQSAIDYLSAIGGGKKLQLGKFYRSSGVEVLANNIVIVGMGGCIDGIGATHIKYIGSPELTNTVAAFSFGQSKTGSGPLIAVKGCVLKGMTIDGNRAGGAKGSAVRATVFDGFNMSDVHTYDCFGNYGFAIVGTGSTPRKYLLVKNCSALRCGADGMDIKAGGERLRIDGFVTGDHLNETTGDSVGVDIRGQYVTVENVFGFNCLEFNVRVRINVGERAPDDTDWSQTEKAKVILNNIYSVGGRDGVELSSPPNSVISASHVHARLATRYGIATSGSGDVLLSDSSSTENLIGLLPSVSGHLYMDNVVIDRNAQDGLPANTAKYITGTNVSIKGNGRYGIQQAATPADAHWRFTNLTLDGNLTNYAVISASAAGLVEFDAASIINATSRGVQIVNTSPAKIKFRGGKISGNATNIHSVNPQTVFTEVEGVVRRTSGTASFFVDSTGVKTIGILHGVGITPRSERVRLSLVRDTSVNDYAVDYVRLDGTSSTVLTVRVNVSAASATAGATALVAWEVDESW